MGGIETRLQEIGVSINGDKPWDIQVHDPRFYNAVLYKQSMGAGESYVAGWWDCQSLDALFFRLLRAQLQKKLYAHWKLSWIALRNFLVNQQSPSKSKDVVNKHYNLGNTLFERMLGKSMAYTCAYWKDAQSLDAAQFAEYELICKKLYLQPGDTVLELGCGWGGLAKFMAEKYGCEVVAVDLGSEPVRYAQELCKNYPVSVYCGDYRDISAYNSQKIKFDKVVSVGVLEHVGNKNYRDLIDIARSFLKQDGIFLLHSIFKDESTNYCDPWIDKYIFPHGTLPSLQQVGKALENNFVVEDLQNLGANYDKTLLAWHENLNKAWPELQSQYSERLHRMMNYYLLSCAGGFRARSMQLYQFALTPEGKVGGYVSIR